MSDRICILANGDIQQLSTPAEIYENPANKFVADFIGETNFLSVDVTNKGQDQPLNIKTPLGIDLELAANSQQGFNQLIEQQSCHATLSLRPEKISINSQGLDINLSGTIVQRTYMGGYTHYTVRTQNGQNLKVSKRNNISNNTSYGINEIVSIGFLQSSVRVLTQ